MKRRSVLALLGASSLPFAGCIGTAALANTHAEVIVQNMTEKQLEVWIQLDEKRGESVETASLHLSPDGVRSDRIELPEGEYTLTTALDKPGPEFKKSITLDIGQQNCASAILTVMESTDSVKLSLSQVAY